MLLRSKNKKIKVAMDVSENVIVVFNIREAMFKNGIRNRRRIEE